MTKRLVSAAASVAAVGVAVLAAAPGAMAQQGGLCQLAGQANFSPSISATSQPFSYSFTGTLSNCQSSVKAPTGGTIAVGTNGLPAASATGSCATSTTSGTAVITWNTGTTTVEQYSTTGVTGAVVIQGSVISSVSTSTGTTYTTNEPSTPVGEGAGGLVTFQPPNPQGCSPGGGGVSSAAINGVVGQGQA